MSQQEGVKDCRIVQVIDLFFDSHPVVHRGGKAPANDTVVVIEKIFQQKNCSIQIGAGAGSDSEDGLALNRHIPQQLGTLLLFSDAADDLAEAILGNHDRLLSLTVALPLFFPILAVLYDEVIEGSGIRGIVDDIPDVYFMVLGVIKPPVQERLIHLKGFLKQQVNGFQDVAAVVDDEKAGLCVTGKAFDVTELLGVITDKVQGFGEGFSFDHAEHPFFCRLR